MLFDNMRDNKPPQTAPTPLLHCECRVCHGGSVGLSVPAKPVARASLIMSLQNLSG